ALLPRDSVDGAARWAASHAPRGRYAMQEVHSAARGYGPYAVPRTALFATPLPLDLSLADSPPESPGGGGPYSHLHLHATDIYSGIPCELC
ncbi:unnamed protein product, partial [Ixodes persulcatus]